jgi:hypothetical protein
LKIASSTKNYEDSSLKLPKMNEYEIVLGNLLSENILKVLFLNFFFNKSLLFGEFNNPTHLNSFVDFQYFRNQSSFCLVRV